MSCAAFSERGDISQGNGPGWLEIDPFSRILVKSPIDVPDDSRGIIERRGDLLPVFSLGFSDVHGGGHSRNHEPHVVVCQ